MKKTILSIAFVTAALFGSSAFAAGTSDNTVENCGNCPTTCVEKGHKGPKADRKKHGRHGQRDEMAAFAGITLTDSQKTSIEKLHADQKAVREARRQKTDTAAMQRPDRRQAHLDYFKAVSDILTPEEYVTFLENVAAGQPKVAKHQGNRHDKNSGKNRREHKGNKREGRQQAQSNQQS